MIFNSFQFIWLFPIIFSLYYLLLRLFKNDNSKKIKYSNLLLTGVSYGLYMQWNPAYVLILLGITLITYYSALIFETNLIKRRKLFLYLAVLLTLSPLIVFKYFNFVADSFTSIIGGNFSVETTLIAPLGISFYTFQSLGYLFDVYRNKIDAEHNLLEYALFVCFFPQILSGPISRACDLLPQIKANRSFDYTKAVKGMRYLLWGMFLKVVMADRCGIFVDVVLSNILQNSGINCLIATFLYTIQIYGDFAGYSYMAMGVGYLMGYKLINNFQRPYFAFSITDFWRRWHISLSSWLKDYVYIPLGGSHCSSIKTYRNIMLTFLISGIWHGANWTFVVWGAIHGIFQVLEKLIGLNKNTSCCKVVYLLKVIVTFNLVNFAWIFFRMPSFNDTFVLLNRIFTNGGAFDPLSGTNLFFCILAISIVFIFDILDEIKHQDLTIFGFKRPIVRWFAYMVTFLLILLTGVLNSSNFIYFNF